MSVAIAEKTAAAKEIDRLGIAYSLTAMYDLAELSPEKRVQVRDSQHYAPPASVARFAQQMNESVFPPIIVTLDGWIVDGNTRVGACEIKSLKFFPALVLDVSWTTATAKRKAELIALAATLNSNGGEQLSLAEARRAVRSMIQLNWKQEQISRSLGIKPSVVGSVRKEVAAEIKMAKVGINSNLITGATKRALAAKDVVVLNDVPFRTLAELADDADLNAPEVIAAARQARETGSDEGQLATFKKLRVEMTDRIHAKEMTGHGKPSMAGQLRQHLGFVTKFGPMPGELVEENAEVAGKHIEALETAIVVLQQVLSQQKALAED